MLQDDEPPKFFMETTKEHKVLRPVKRAKTHESHTVSEEGPLHGKMGPTEPRGVEGMYQKFAMRQQRKDVSPKYKEAQRELRCYFSGVCQRRIEKQF